MFLYFINTALKKKNFNEAKSHLKNLVALAMSDGHLAEIEEHLMLAVTRSLGLSPEDLKNIQNSPDQIKFVVPESYDNKLEQFNDMVMLVSVDGHIDDEEMKYCWKLADKFELPSREVEKILSRYL